MEAQRIPIIDVDQQASDTCDSQNPWPLWSMDFQRVDDFFHNFNSNLPRVVGTLSIPKQMIALSFVIMASVADSAIHADDLAVAEYVRL